MLQEEGDSLEKQANDLTNTINELEKKTKLLEQQYETLIREKQEIVTDMAKVEDKVSRSKNLLNNLSSEKYRWEDTSKNFKVQIASVLGDVFLSSAFLAYIGFFDHYYRKLLYSVWRSNLATSRVKYREELSLIEFLSQPNERLNWRSHKLPSDDLCTENAIIMKRYHKYPLIIDPAGQAMEYLLSLFADKSFILSSFADDAFLKNLEKSLRFGRPLIVQDV
jgi:dynein heavy chain 1